MRERTSVCLDPEIRREAEAAARRLGISVSSLVNQALAALLRCSQPARRLDPVFRRHPFRARRRMGGIDEAVYDRP